MEQDSNPSGLCKNGCGFYGNHSYEGMCSKCYKDFVKRQQQSSSSGRASPASCASAASLAAVSASTRAAVSAASLVAPSASSMAASSASSLAASPASSLVGSLSHTVAAITPPALSTQSIALATPPTDTTSTLNTALLNLHPEPSTPPKADTLGEVVSPQSAETPSSSSPLEDDSPGKSKKRNRCYSCRKKVGLTGFECRCGGLFCGLHRYSDKHNCTYDYKADGRAEIAKQNPVVVGEKVKKI